MAQPTWSTRRGCTAEGHVGDVEEIKNYNDEVIGRQCRLCLKVLSGVGKCDGCGKDKAELRYVVGESHYCGRECRKLELQERDAAPR